MGCGWIMGDITGPNTKYESPSLLLINAGSFTYIPKQLVPYSGFVQATQKRTSLFFYMVGICSPETVKVDNNIVWRCSSIGKLASENKPSKSCRGLFLKTLWIWLGVEFHNSY